MLPLRRANVVWKRAASIFAMSSGSLPAALAIVRITGPESKEALQRLTGKSEFEPGRLFYSSLFDEKRELIDRGMAVFMKGPHTFTGEDTVELFPHGSRAIVSKLLDTLGSFPSLTPAKAGEFTRRAFMNSKLDVAQLESLADLLQAETPAQLRLAHRQNAAARLLQPFRNRLVALIAQLEAEIDFGDDIEEQQSGEWRRKMGDEVEALEGELAALLRSTRRGILIRNGVRISLVGRTNVGKSSLINRLAARDVAIVSNLPGTTRDLLEARVLLGSLSATITDTAGLRQTSDELEKEGIARTIKRAQDSHIVVLVVSAESLQAEGRKIEEEVAYLREVLPDLKTAELLVCVNKSDLLSEERRKEVIEASKQPLILINTLSDEAVNPLVAALADRMGDVSDEGNDVVLSRERHVHLLERALEELGEFHENSADSALAAQHLRNAAEAVGEISGLIVSETILNSIFSQFCIGK